MQSLRNTLIEQINELCNAEQQLERAIPFLASHASSPGIKRYLHKRIERTQRLGRRLEQMKRALAWPFQSCQCTVIERLLGEVHWIVEQNFASESLRDLMMVLVLQKMERYNVAATSNARALADLLNLEDVVCSLNTTISEAKCLEEELSELCRREVYPACQTVAAQMAGKDLRIA